MVFLNCLHFGLLLVVHDSIVINDGRRGFIYYRQCECASSSCRLIGFSAMRVENAELIHFFSLIFDLYINIYKTISIIPRLHFCLFWKKVNEWFCICFQFSFVLYALTAYRSPHGTIVERNPVGILADRQQSGSTPSEKNPQKNIWWKQQNRSTMAHIPKRVKLSIGIWSEEYEVNQGIRLVVGFWMEMSLRRNIVIQAKVSV